MDLKLASEDQQMVWAEVYAPNIPDADGDIMTEEAIEQMAYKFMRERKTDRIDLQHNNKLINAHIIESFIARKGDPDFIPGAWVVGMHIADKGVWSMIKKGEINGYSMEALVTRSPSTMEVEIPPVIRGLVAKADDGHDHEFFVSYDDQGQFLGGRTSSAPDGHSHVIRKGTVTETVMGHNHRFSFVEKVLWGGP
jgi:Putative phage serine protease XkdF